MEVNLKDQYVSNRNYASTVSTLQLKNRNNGRKGQILNIEQCSL